LKVATFPQNGRGLPLHVSAAFFFLLRSLLSSESMDESILRHIIKVWAAASMRPGLHLQCGERCAVVRNRNDVGSNFGMASTSFLPPRSGRRRCDRSTANGAAPSPPPPPLRRRRRRRCYLRSPSRTTRAYTHASTYGHMALGVTEPKSPSHTTHISLHIHQFSRPSRAIIVG
jgi:hypothetical protein